MTVSISFGVRPPVSSALATPGLNSYGFLVERCFCICSGYLLASDRSPRSNSMRKGLVFEFFLPRYNAASGCVIRKARDGTVALAERLAGKTKKRSGRVMRPPSNAEIVTKI